MHYNLAFFCVPLVYPFRQDDRRAAPINEIPTLRIEPCAPLRYLEIRDDCRSNQQAKRAAQRV